METIAFIIPYFGRLHNYFYLFLESCKANETVDFIFISDIKDFPKMPPNCKRIKMSFQELSEKITRILGFKTSLASVYKIVDFKPMWGDVFQDGLKKYDYWGFCDCDMILGDLRSFFERIQLSGYDKIFCHGHMTVLKNNETMRHLYKTKGGFEKEGVFNYEEAFRTKCVVHFDEGGGLTEISKYLNIKTYECVDYADISFQRKRFTLAQPVPTALYPCVFTYEPLNLNRVFIKDKEMICYPVLYVHLQKRKMKIDLYPGLEKYHIVPNKFAVSREISVDYILKNARDGLYWSEYKRRIRQQLYRLSPARIQITLRNKRICRMEKNIYEMDH